MRVITPIAAAALTLALALLSPSPGFCGWEPPGWVQENSSRELPVSTGSVILQGALSLYRSSVSPTYSNGSRCPSYPSCSAYAVEAIHTHGALKGAMLTASRLLSESDEAAFSPRIRVGGRELVYYPVEKSLFPGGNSHD